MPFCPFVQIDCKYSFNANLIQKTISHQINILINYHSFQNIPHQFGRIFFGEYSQMEYIDGNLAAFVPFSPFSISVSRPKRMSLVFPRSFCKIIIKKLEINIDTELGFSPIQFLQHQLGRRNNFPNNFQRPFGLEFPHGNLLNWAIFGFVQSILEAIENSKHFWRNQMNILWSQFLLKKDLNWDWGHIILADHSRATILPPFPSHFRPIYRQYLNEWLPYFCKNKWKI